MAYNTWNNMLKNHPSDKTTQFSRILSLDVFRGLTIALMILVNSPGNNTAYAWLEHSTWDGCTLADLVFPFFIFIIGVSCVLSLSKARERGLSTQQLLPKIIKRSILIFLIGLFLNAFPYHFDWASIRIVGVLQRIALCYFFTAWLFLKTSVRAQAFIIMAILIGYWFVLTLFSAPHYGVENNVAAYVDRLFFGPAHLYLKTSDPEGILSTLPALATALIGNLTGVWLLANTSKQHKLAGMIAAGSLVLGIGFIWGLWLPINKALWTSSYVLWTGGLALLLLAGCYGLIEMKGWTAWSKFFEIFGVNALAAYVLHVFFLKVQMMVTISLPDHGSQNLKLFITESLFGWASLANASLLYALSYTLFWFIVLAFLYRKKIYIRI